MVTMVDGGDVVNTHGRWRVSIDVQSSIFSIFRGEKKNMSSVYHLRLKHLLICFLLLRRDFDDYPSFPERVFWSFGRVSKGYHGVSGLARDRAAPWNTETPWEPRRTTTTTTTTR